MQKNTSSITSIKHVEGKWAATVNTSTAGGNLLYAQPLVKIKYVRDYFIAFSELKNGHVDAFTTDETVLSAILKEDGHPEQYRFLHDFTKSRDVGFALKTGEDRFKALVNQNSWRSNLLVKPLKFGTIGLAPKHNNPLHVLLRSPQAID